jgi:molybdenum cofactor synthesis domain-containing protein
MISEHDALRHVLDRCPRLGPVTRTPSAALGLVTVQSIIAAEDVPPFVNSAVDGYAVRSSDVAAPPVELRVVAEVAAGAATDRVVGSGEAIRIMTGAPVPAGADAIVMVEDTERLDGAEGGSVRITASVSPGSALRGVGDDVAAGALLYPAGTEVRPAVAGVLRSVNVGEVHVTRRPRVAVLSTGDELVDDGGPLRPGQIRESNKTMLLAMVTEAGCDTLDVGIIRDDESALEAALREAAESCDAIVTSGGVSMGDYDVVKAVLSTIAEMRWMQIAIKPAKPFAFGQLTRSTGELVPVFGLPGNPVSSLVSFELFARPALRQMMGHRAPGRPLVPAVAVDGLARRPDGKTHYMRVFAEFSDAGTIHVTSIGAQGSHQLAATSLANAIAIVPDGDGVAPGDSVLTMLLSLG